MTNGVKTVFLDRDGVINVPTGIPHTYVTRWVDFEFLPGAQEAIRKLNGAGFRVVVVTNQRGIARGKMSEADLAGIHHRMDAELRQAGARIDAIYHCPHEGGCGCRKPEAGMLEQADRDCAVDKAASYMVGDSPSDIGAGKSFGVKTVLISDDDGELHGADCRSGSLLEFAIQLEKGSI